MKRLLSMLLVVMMVMSLAATAVYAEEETEVTLPFTDVKDGKWFTDAVKYVYANGLMNGKEETKFAPNEVLTRAQFAKMLWSLAGEPATEADLKFADTKNTQWYAESLTWAVNSGIVNGYEEGGKKLFKPNKNIARDELAKMIVTFLAFMEVEIVGEDIAEPFPDKIQNWAKEFVEAVRLSGLMKGKDGGAFAPKANATRAEGATIIMRMHPSLALTPTKVMEEIVENFLGEYQCTTHQDIFIVSNFGSSHSNEAICEAIVSFLGLDTEIYTLAVTSGEVPNEGCGRQGYDYGDLEFTLTHKESGESVEFATGVVCFKYYNMGANDEDGTVRCYQAEPIYVLPVGCPEDISSITEPKVAEDALAAFTATDFVVTEFTYEGIWNAINDALDFEAKKNFELVLKKDELDAVIAAYDAATGTSAGKITLTLERISKTEVTASIEIDATFILKSVADMQEAIDTFLDSTECVHGDYNFMFTYGGSMTVESTLYAVAQAVGGTDKYTVELDGDTNTSGWQAARDSYGNCDWAAYGGGGVIKFLLVDNATGLKMPFEFKFVGSKHFSLIDYQANGLDDFHNTDWDNGGGNQGEGYCDGIGVGATPFYAPWWCNDNFGELAINKYADEVFAQLDQYKAEDGYVEIPVSNFADITAQTGTAYGHVWYAINDLLDYDAQQYYMVLTADTVHDLIVNGGEGTLKIKITSSSSYPAIGKGTFKEINFRFIDKTAIEMQEAIDAFLDSTKCVHGDYNFIHTWGSSLCPENVLYAVTQAIGNPAKYYVTLDGDLNSSGYQAVKDAFSGVDRYQGAGGPIKFILNDIATGTKVPFEFKYQAQKHFSKIEQLDSGKDFEDTSWDNAYDSCGEGYSDALGVGVQPVYVPEYCSDLYGDLDTTKYMQGKFDESFADYKDDNGTVVIPVADLASITTKNADAYKAVWYTINDILEYDHPEYYMILTADTVHDLIANGGEGVLKIKLSPSSGWVPQTKGAFQEINFKFVQKTTDEIVEDFLAKALCTTHGQIEMVANFSSSVSADSTIAAFVDGLGINTATHTLELLNGFDDLKNAYGGAGHGTSAGGTLSFKLTEVATGVATEFDTNVYLTKMLGTNDDGNGWYYHENHPMAIKWGCPDEVSSLKTIPVCQQILSAIHCRRDANGVLNIKYDGSDSWNLRAIGAALYEMLPVFNHTHYALAYNYGEMETAIANGSGNVTFRVFNAVKGEQYVKAEVVIPVTVSAQ